MTRGNFVIIYCGEIYASVQFNGDMYPDGNGNAVLEMLKNVNNVESLNSAVELFDAERFGYKNEMCVDSLINKNWKDLDFSKTYFADYNSDYLYIKNCDNTIYKIIDREGRRYDIAPNQIQIWEFGRLHKLTEEEKDGIKMRKADDAKLLNKWGKYVYADAQADACQHKIDNRKWIILD